MRVGLGGELDGGKRTLAVVDGLWSEKGREVFWTGCALARGGTDLR
jgi:hypothetical protein